MLWESIVKTRHALCAASTLALLLVSLAASADSQRPDFVRPMASKDWRDQVIYFLMIDRFDDGDAGNNDQGAQEYSPSAPEKFSGGDLAGIERRIDYLKGLGATALWITPPVANQWWDARVRYGGYHGYWAQNFKQVDAHFGDLARYRALAAALHQADMLLIQDIVVNHTGNYFGYHASWDSQQPAKGFQRYRSEGRRAPSQAPFDQNRADRAADRAAAIYHWTPDIADYSDSNQLLNFQLAGLDDLNTDNATVRSALRDSYGFWIKEVGVDAFRVDTAFYVAPEYFSDFLYSSDVDAPGISRVAKATGRDHFHVFGEGFALDRAFEESQAKRIESYVRTPDGQPLMPAMLNFPLYGSLLEVFARGRPTKELSYRIESMMRVHESPHLMPTFIDNHDVDRFLAQGNAAGLRQALLSIFTLPGIPTIYYGTEQGFIKRRGAMFAGGYGSGGKDHFDTNSALYQYLRALADLRKEHAVLRRGVPKIWRDSAGAGLLVYSMQPAGDKAGQAAHNTAGAPEQVELLIVHNSADGPMLLDALQLAPSSKSTRANRAINSGLGLRQIFSCDDAQAAVTIDPTGAASMLVPAHACLVFAISRNASKPVGGALSCLALDPVRIDSTAEAIEIAGRILAQSSVQNSAQSSGQELGPASERATSSEPLLIVIDDKMAAATSVKPDADGRFNLKLPFDAIVDGRSAHHVLALAPDSMQTSPRQSFQIQRTWQLLAELEDPLGDDRGPKGHYVYPSDPGWGARRQLDIQAVKLEHAGKALRLTLRMRDLSDGWSPANAFDRVAFSIFLTLPDARLGPRPGASVLPQQFASMPNGLRWQYRLRAHGWSNAIFGHQNASETAEGDATGLASEIAVDQEKREIHFVFPNQLFLDVSDWTGLSVYVNTWDFDSGYRALAPMPASMIFGGGTETDPKIMDAALLVVPKRR